MNINKSVCLGLILSGVVSYFSEEEKNSINEAMSLSVKHIENRLWKKLFSFRHGGVAFREKIQKLSKKKKHSKRDRELILKYKEYEARYSYHNAIADEVWESLKIQSKEYNLSLNHLVNAVIYRSNISDVYGFKKEQLLVFSGGNSSSSNVNLFASIKVANILIKILDEKIEKINKDSGV